MKICFICGCLESGKDGVGDYVQVLSKELLLLGVTPGIVALHDSFIAENKEDHSDIPTLRLSSEQKWSSKLQKAEEWIKKFNPDHVNLQFVIYGYDPKGLPFKAMFYIQKILRTCSSVSIMLHEPWIGRSHAEPIKRRIIGMIQRTMIKGVTRIIKPKIIHTSNIAFHKLLGHFRIPSRILPLFSNIPYVPGSQKEVQTWLAKNGYSIGKDVLKVGIFGRIPHQWKLKELIAWLQGENAVLFLLGRSDQIQVDELKKEINQISPDILTINLGEQSPQFVSGFLQYMDLGVAVTAPQILGKSGVVAAYKEHGLPVVLAGQDEYFRHVHVEPNLQSEYVLLNHSLVNQRYKLVKKEITDTRKSVVKQWIQDIKHENSL